MKKILVSLILSFSWLFSNECILISSPYTKMEHIVESSFYGQDYYSYYRVGDKNKSRTFSEAYVLFVNALSDNAKEHCKKNGYTGVYNVKISHSVLEQFNTSKIYFFTASVDYIKH